MHFDLNPFRDSRLSDEALAYNQFIAEKFPLPLGFPLEEMRERYEGIHAQANKELLGRIKGIEEKTVVKIDSAGRIQ